MIEIDNFRLISEILEWPSEKDKNQCLFFVQLLRRSKDGNSLLTGNNKNRCVRSYSIRTKLELVQREEEIKALCKLTNARAYIYPAVRSWKGIAAKMTQKAVEMYMSENYSGFKYLFDSVAAQSCETKRWIVDLDDEYADKTKEIEMFIEEQCRPFGKTKVLAKVPTVHGMHLITAPFDCSAFGKEWPEIDIHKNNPTLLYYFRED